MSNKSTEVSFNCCGCFVFIITMFALWALIAGVNIGGKHYGVSCGNNDVDVSTGGK